MNSLSPLRCPHGCKSVKQGFKLVRRYGPHYTPLYECLRCGQQFSGRYDSVFSGFHTDEQTIYRVLKALSEGIGIRAAARIFDLDKNTVVLILERAAEHCKRGSEQLIKNYPMDECQLDELSTQSLQVRRAETLFILHFQWITALEERSWNLPGISPLKP